MYNHISHSASQICRVSFYIVILLARINAHIQALLRQGFGIPSENRKVKKGKETFGKQPSVNIRVVTKWYAKVPPANFCHRKPTKVPQMSYSGRLTCRGFFIQKKTAPKSSLFFVSSRKGFMRLCRLFQSFRV